MDVSLDTISQEFQKNIPLFILFSAGLIAVVLVVKRMLKETFERLESKVDGLLAQKDKVDILASNFNKYQDLLHVLKGEESIFIVFDAEIDTIINLLSQNFSNGSSLDKAMNDINDCRHRLLEAIQDKTDLPHKGHYVVLVDVLYEKMSRLVSSLASLTDYTIKGKLIAPYGKALFQMVNYFGISMEKKYPELSETQVKNDLSTRFREYGTRLPHNRISTI